VQAPGTVDVDRVTSVDDHRRQADAQPEPEPARGAAERRPARTQRADQQVLAPRKAEAREHRMTDEGHGPEPRLNAEPSPLGTREQEPADRPEGGRTPRRQDVRP